MASLPSRTSVSYTHLDVYKRQTLPFVGAGLLAVSSANGRDLDIPFTKTTLADGMVAILSVDPVSYTHLPSTRERTKPSVDDSERPVAFRRSGTGLGVRICAFDKRRPPRPIHHTPVGAVHRGCIHTQAWGRARMRRESSSFIRVVSVRAPAGSGRRSSAIMRVADTTSASWLPGATVATTTGARTLNAIRAGPSAVGASWPMNGASIEATRARKSIGTPSNSPFLRVRTIRAVAVGVPRQMTRTPPAFRNRS